MSHYRHFRVEPKGYVTVLELLDPRLADALVVTELQDELLDLIESQNPTHLLIDFRNVAQCSTAVINGLLRSKKRLLADGGELKLCGMRPLIREAYQMLNLDGTVFQIYDTVDDALDAY
jgi:anti-anti-sigma regulatory factor